MLSKEAAQQVGERQKKERNGDSSTHSRQQRSPSGGIAKHRPFILGLQESQHKDSQLNVQVHTGISCPGEDGCVNIWEKYVFVRIQRSTRPDPLDREIPVLVFA